MRARSTGLVKKGPSRSNVYVSLESAGPSDNKRLLWYQHIAIDPKLKIYTSAFRPFKADDAFYSRDSGLLSRALREHGIDSRIVLPGQDQNDPPDIVRASEGEFANPEWWRSLNIDAVVFIAWGFREHTPVIKAARAADIVTIAIIETSGNPYPMGGVFSMMRTTWRKGKFNERIVKRIIGTAGRLVFQAVKGFGAQYHRSVQIKIPHYASFSAPTARNRCVKVTSFYPWLKSDTRSLALGYPISDTFEPRMYDQRRRNVVAIGRWFSRRHKRPDMLMRVIEHVLAVDAGVTFEIFGRVPPDMVEWRASLDAGFQERVALRGVRPSREVSEAIGTSQVLYCPSAADGIPLAVAEGLCGGCSVAGLRTRDVAALHWACEEGDGSSAQSDTVANHAAAVLAELEFWRTRRRDPARISKRWKERFSAKHYAGKMIRLVQDHSTTES